MEEAPILEKPPWLKVRLSSVNKLEGVRTVLRRTGVSTVCDSSRCPNVGECWGRGEATFMILGRCCTRSCRFCAVEHGGPSPPDPHEPERVAQAAASLGLRYVVVTSVTRDDLKDGGAGAFVATVEELRASVPGARTELLVSDMKGDSRSVEKIAVSGADVIGHNIEVVESLQEIARDRAASYDRSLDVLNALSRAGNSVVKSSIMLGLGEEVNEVRTTLRDMRSVGVDIVTIGQYIAPKGGDLPVSRYVTPSEFEDLACYARSIGFRIALSGPLVRSSYHASDAYEALVNGG